jgi:hypothetical protein
MARFPVSRISTGAFLPHRKQIVRFQESPAPRTQSGRVSHLCRAAYLKCRVGYPKKGIAKNFASLATYPHSAFERLEKPPFTNQT